MTCALDVCDGAEAPPARRRYWFADKMISRRFAFIKIVWLTSVPPPRPARLSARSLALPQHSTLPEQQHGALSEQETLLFQVSLEQNQPPAVFEQFLATNEHFVDTFASFCPFLDVFRAWLLSVHFKLGSVSSGTKLHSLRCHSEESTHATPKPLRGRQP